MLTRNPFANKETCVTQQELNGRYELAANLYHGEIVNAARRYLERHNSLRSILDWDDIIQEFSLKLLELCQEDHDFEIESGVFRLFLRQSLGRSLSDISRWYYSHKRSQYVSVSGDRPIMSEESATIFDILPSRTARQDQIVEAGDLEEKLRKTLSPYEELVLDDLCDPNELVDDFMEENDWFHDSIGRQHKRFKIRNGMNISIPGLCQAHLHIGVINHANEFYTALWTIQDNISKLLRDEQVYEYDDVLVTSWHNQSELDRGLHWSQTRRARDHMSYTRRN